MQDNITGWFTTDEGNHVPIHGGQSKVQAMKQFANEHKSTRLREASRRFAEEEGIAVLKGEEDTSIVRWLGSGSLTENQIKRFSEIYESMK